MTKLDELAESLLTKFQRDFPLLENKKGAEKKIKLLPNQSIDERLDRFYAEAHELRTSNRLWVINWARVILKLQQRLTSAGYPPDIVSKLLLAMIFSAHKPKNT